MESSFQKGISLKVKLMVLFMLVAVAPLLAGGLWTVNNVKSKLIENVLNKNMLVAEQLSVQVDQLVKNRVDLAASLAQTRNISNMDPDELESLLVPVKDYYQDIDVIGIINKSGMQIFRSDDGDLLDLSDRSYYTEVMAGKDFSVSDVIISRSSGKPIVVIGTPIKKDGDVQGVFQISLSLAGLDDLLANSRVGKTGYSFITDGQGKVVAHPDEAIAAEQTDFADLAPVAAGLNNEKGTTEYVFENDNWQSCYTVTPFLNWIVVTQQVTDEVIAEADAMGQKTLLVLAVGALVAALLGIMLSSVATRSLGTLRDGLLSLADGDLTNEVEIKSKDEIGELAHAFNQTVSNLRKLIVQIKSSSVQLTDHSSELASSSQEVNATVEEVAGTTNEVATTSTQGAENAEEAARESHQALLVAEEGNQAVRQTIEKINSILSASENVSKSIHKLGDQSNKIGEIINTITSIADQTNLLALNAAIEAARAGEHGKGFAVVAEEVRKLAEQSAAAANEITGLINEIQVGVGEAVTAMEFGAVEVNEGVIVANNAGASLQQIIKAIEKNTEIIKDVAEGARLANEGTQQLTSASEQIASTMQQVSGAAQGLAGLAEELQSRVVTFNIEKEGDAENTNTQPSLEA